MTATETLRHEHDVILMVLDAAEREAESAGKTGRVDAERIEKLLEFVRNFADRCHHAKEENHLFAKMADRGFPVQFGPIGVMLREHEQGRAHVRAVADALPAARAGDHAAVTALAEALQAYVELLRAHIAKENNVLYPMADQAFTPADQEALVAAFEKVEAEELGEGVHERFHHLAHELAGR